MKKNTKIKIILFSIAVIANLLMFFYLYSSRGQDFFNPLTQGTDQAEYGRIAINLVERRSFSVAELDPYIPNPARTPIFPLFLSLSYLLTGGFILAILLNILISAITAIIVFDIAFLAAKRPNIAFLSGLIFALLPYKIYLSNLIMADIFFMFFFSLFALSFLKIIEDEEGFNFKNATLAGSLLGLSVLVRPITQFFIVIPVFITLLFFKKDFKKRIAVSVLLVVSFVLVLTPWLLRNEIHFGEPFLSSVGRYHMYVSYLAPWQAYKEKVSRDEKHREVLEYIEGQYGNDAMYNIEASTELSKIAKKEILRNPLSYLFFHLSSVPIYFLNNDFMLTAREAFNAKLPDVYIAQKIFSLDFKGLRQAIFSSGIFFTAFFLISYLVVAIKSGLGVLWVFYYLKRSLYINTFVILSILYFPLLIGFEGHARFRIPIEPFLIIFSVLAIFDIWKFMKEKFFKPQNENF
ncbi:MAG: glycosyltransferase family 39 protein [Parcubacteria group bacterium]|nr:glycosyltransferase family 39 protein [Parcubacteria group bacterium]MCR4342510.1 glycosyltransferase family 39 protein [Patescibacteria group bacterium]